MELPLYIVLERLRHVNIAVSAQLCAEHRIAYSAVNPKQNVTVELIMKKILNKGYFLFGNTGNF